jgi:hypothetical protein
MIELLLLFAMFTLLAYMISTCFKNTKNKYTYFDISSMAETEASDLTKELSEINDKIKKQIAESRNNQK